MHNKLIIIGAGGHGKVIADIALKNDYTDIAFLDDNFVGECMDFKVIGKSNDAPKYNDGETDFIIAVGNNKTRKKIAQSIDVDWTVLIHPSAQIGANVKILPGTVIMAGAVVNPCATIGTHCIVNTCSVIEHDNIIEDYVHISPNATLGGTVHVGECTHIGIAATVKNNINICSYCTVGAGAVVVSDLVGEATYIGVPAKRF